MDLIFLYHIKLYIIILFLTSSVSAEGTKLLIMGLLRSWQSFSRIDSHGHFRSFGKHTIQLASRMTPYLTECKWDESCKALVKNWIEVPCSASFQNCATMIKLENEVIYTVALR